MQVTDVRPSVAKDNGHVGFCPHCRAMITQKSSMFKCFHCHNPIIWSTIQELAETIRTEISQTHIDKDEINRLLDNIILETRNITLTKGN